MKKILLLILSCNAIYAMNSRQVQASGANPIPSSYSASNSQSLILSELSGSDSNVLITATMNDVVCDLGAPYSNQVPATQREVFLVASEPLLLRELKGVKNIYCKGNNTTRTAGWISILTY